MYKILINKKTNQPWPWIYKDNSFTNIINFLNDRTNFLSLKIEDYNIYEI